MIDLALEIFKGISPTVLALVTVLLTEYFIRKRNDIYKRREMKLQYLENILSWIHETRKKIFKINNALNKTLSIKDIEKRITEYNMNVEIINEMNESVFVWCDTYDEVTKSFGYDFKLAQFKESINCYSKQITDVGKKYLNCINTQESIDQMNAILYVVKEEMQESISILVDTINSLYGK